MSFVIALIGFFCGALVNIFDKFILSTKKVAPSVFVFYSTTPLLPLLIAAPFVAPLALVQSTMPILILGALGFFFGIVAMYRAVLASEVSHVGPLLGAVVPLMVVILSWLFLGEILTVYQLGAALLLITGSLIISFDLSGGRYDWRQGIWWALASGFSFAIFHIASKYSYSQIGFVPGLFWISGLMSIPGLLLIFIPAVRVAAFGPKNAQLEPALVVVPHQGVLVIADKALGVATTLLVQYAVSIGSVSLVNALSGAQFAFLVIMVALLSKFFPRVIKETYTRQEIFQEILAIALIGIGIAILFIK